MTSASQDSGAARRVAGCDLGKATAKFVIGAIRPGGFEIEASEVVDHRGDALAAFRAWYRRADIYRCAALGVTGLHAGELIDPAVAGLPEEACLEAALDRLPALRQGPLNLIRVGARGYSVLTRDARGRINHLENDKCSSGTGETMVKIAGRFGLSIAEADAAARAAEARIPITARCSVFAKSEMTHFGNQGRPADQLFRGYFASVANYAAALLARARVDGPVLVIGGGARLGAFVDGLGDVLGEPVTVPERAGELEAIGAAVLAGDQLGAGALAPLPEDPDAIIEVVPHRFRVLEPAGGWRDRVDRMTAPSPPPGAEREPSLLGLDLGSTGSKAVLTSLASGEIVLDLYDRTRGNPVDAARRLIAVLLDRVNPDVRAIGVTGSGREAVATVLRAAFPEQADRIVVINEIVAHATAAIRCDPDRGRDLSIVEIGGQDAKYVQVLGGQIVESDMNKACSAGTGSFLEEQAVFYGVDDIVDFTEIAQRAERPPELGQMCTVFVAEAAEEAHREGFSIPDLFGGFQYAVIHNYINRVMGQRTFGKRIFFQGKPATGPALAWTLAAVTGREVVVPPNPGAMGAWGIGLCAREQLDTDVLAGADRFDLTPVLAAEVVGRAEFQCKDKKCATLCNIERTTVRVGDSRHQVLSGGACPKYEISGAARPKLAADAPSAFDERAALLAPFLEDSPGERTVALPLVGAYHGHFPWLVTFLRELGVGVEILGSDPGSLARGEARCYSFDACAPIKIAHGVVDAEVDTLFLPKILSLGDRDGRGGTTCPMEQGLPEMTREALRARGRTVEVVHPPFEFDAGLTSFTLARQARAAAARLGVGVRQVPRALQRAAQAQRAYKEALAEIGRRTLAFGRAHGVPVVVVCGVLHVIHERGVNAGIPRLLRENGVLALPMDCLPLPPTIPAMERITWAETSRALRAAVAARRLGDVYPLLLSSFGCGPASFSEQIFSALMEGYPHTSLESDGHGGAAGYVTRVQAFLHTVFAHDRRPSPVPGGRLDMVELLPMPPVTAERDSRMVLFSVGGQVARLVAASMRSFGFDVVTAPPADSELLALGRRDCSGKECLPYQLIWGSFRRYLEDNPSDRRTRLLQISGKGSCRNCMFSIKDQLSVERLGLADQVGLRHLRTDTELGWRYVARLYSAVIAWDLFNQLASYHRPYEREPGGIDRIYREHCDRLEAFLLRPIEPEMSGFRRERQRLHSVVDSAASAFLAAARPLSERGDQRTVFLSGDLYIRLDDFASDDLVRRLNARGLSVIVEPLSAFQEYMADEPLMGLLSRPRDLIHNTVIKYSLKLMRHDLYSRVRALHPWLPETDIAAMAQDCGRLLDTHPKGEAAVTVGSVLHTFAEGYCDGVVVASPWGCAPALVSEALLRHAREIPILFVYCDGSPIDQRRLNAFAFRLRRDPPRRRFGIAGGARPEGAGNGSLMTGLADRLRRQVGSLRAEREATSR